MSNSSGLQGFLAVQAFVIGFLWLVLTYFGVTGSGDVFYTSHAFLREKYYQESTPVESIIDLIWVVVCVWNFIAITYIALSLCLPEKKSPINVQPTLVSTYFLICYCLVFAFMIGWLFSADRELLGLSLPLLVIATVVCFITVGLSYKRIYDNTIYLESKDTRVMLWLIRIFIQNGLSLLATWLSVLVCFALADVLLYIDSFSFFPAIELGIFPIEDASSVVLAFLLANIILWFTLDLVVYENYVRYTFSVYPLLIFVSAGLVAKLQHPSEYRNFVFSAVTLAFCVFALVFRIGYFIWGWRARRREA